MACGDATACIVPFQVAKIKPASVSSPTPGSGVRWAIDLPAAIGAAVAREGKRVICLAGDGSIQMNLQELETVVHNRLKIKIFVLSNGGYLSIRTTQKNFFGNLVGEGPTSGVGFPDVQQARPGLRDPLPEDRRAGLRAADRQALAGDGPFLCEVVLDQAQTFEPRLSSRQLPDGRIVTAPPEDMFPFLDREEFRSNLLVPQADA